MNANITKDIPKISIIYISIYILELQTIIEDGNQIESLEEAIKISQKKIGICSWGDN